MYQPVARERSPQHVVIIGCLFTEAYWLTPSLPVAFQRYILFGKPWKGGSWKGFGIMDFATALSLVITTFLFWQALIIY